MTSYRLTTAAQRSLIEIETYSLETFGKKHAANYMRELAKRMEWLAENPKLGKPRPELSKEASLLSYPQASHMIYFQSIGPEQIVVIDVLHQSMEPELHL